MLRIVTISILAAAFAAVFLAYPELDTNISSRFYDPELGFYLENSSFAIFVYYGVRVLCGLLVCFLVLQALLIFKKTRSFSFRHYLDQLYVGAVLLLGPGLLIHNVIKVIFARPRPREIFMFGGDYPFEPIFSLHNHCATCHSFVSGHAAIGFVFIAFALLCKNSKARLALTTFALLFGLWIGFARVIVGAHFASDIIFSGFATFFVAYALYPLHQKLKSS